MLRTRTKCSTWAFSKTDPAMVNLADVHLGVEAGPMTDADPEMLKDSAWLQNRPRGAGHGF